MEVSEVPVWKDSHHRVPRDYVLRRNDEHVILSYEPDGCAVLHCDIDAEEFTPKMLRVMARNLGSNRFEKEYPGEFIPMVKRRAERGGNISSHDRKKWERYRQLTGSKI